MPTDGLTGPVAVLRTVLVKASGPAPDPRTYPWPIGRTWLAHPEEPMQRASHALGLDGGVWLVDPLDATGIDHVIEELGTVAGVVVLLDRHTRDAATFARRYDVAVHVPELLGDGADDLDASVERFEGELADTGYRARPVVQRRFWREAALVAETGETVVVADALCTAPLYLAPGEHVGVHPFLRLRPPRRALGDLDPDRLLVGHGPPVLNGAGQALREALAGARRRAPRAYWNSLVTIVRR